MNYVFLLYIYVSCVDHFRYIDYYFLKRKRKKVHNPFPLYYLSSFNFVSSLFRKLQVCFLNHSVIFCLVQKASKWPFLLLSFRAHAAFLTKQPSLSSITLQPSTTLLAIYLHSRLQLYLFLYSQYFSISP